jgi:hypothetical protein
VSPHDATHINAELAHHVGGRNFAKYRITGANQGSWEYRSPFTCLSSGIRIQSFDQGRKL